MKESTTGIQPVFEARRPIKSEAIKIAETIIQAGSMLLTAGAEVYRVEETMQRMGLSIEGVKECNPYVSATGIMCTVCTEDEMATKVARIYSSERNISIINAINSLSRKCVHDHLNVLEIDRELNQIKHIPVYHAQMKSLFGAIGAGGFAVFFYGGLMDVAASFVIGWVIRECGLYFEKIRLNPFLIIIVQSFVAAIIARISHYLSMDCDVNTIIISTLMLLVPGLSITNGIRDTMMGDYLSGLVRFTESFVIAASIAIGAGLGIYAF
ncbi:threonine/serine ThrE exporter family protein [Ileibacterium valens]|uniref:threonine/serine ThrE exporter family protein n=1 Tax=Ileibacterium valens TaxID=1862668 RepID=UPI0025742CEC|nr:threonine/serine exporter family protein [Ileibacterium valens]